MITIKGICKQYFGYDKVIDDLSLDISTGEHIIIYGASGSGKTTLLKLLAGLIDADEGEILINGRNIKDIRPKDLDAAMIFEDLAIPKYKVVRKILRRPFLLRGMKRKQAGEKVREIAEKLSLTPHLDTPGILLNMYDRVRTAVTRAIMREPEILLADNPLKNLSIPERKEYFPEFYRLISQLKGTVIYCTDDREEMKYSDGRIVILENGYIKQIGLYRELLVNPHNLSVARIINNDMNFIHCALSNGKVIIFGKNFETSLENTCEKDAVIGIHADKLRLVKGGVLPVKMNYLRGDGRAEVEIDGVFIICNALDKDADGINIDISEAFIFDSADEKRIYGEITT